MRRPDVAGVVWWRSIRTGRVDESLPDLSNYVEDRERELNVLADPGLRARLAEHGFIVSAFGELDT